MLNDNVEKVYSFPLALGKGERAILQENAEGKTELVVWREKETPKEKERDVTSECWAELRTSMSSEGVYVAIGHGAKDSVFLFGICAAETPRLVRRYGNYRLVSAKGARIGFRVMMKEEI